MPVTPTTIPVTPGTGLTLDATQVTVSATSVVRETMVIADAQTGSSYAGVVTTDPGSSDAGLTVRDVRGNASLPVRTDPTGTTTQPVSGTVTATQATGSNLHVVVDTAPTTAVTGTFWQATQPVSDVNLELSQGSTTSGQKGPLVQGAVTTGSPTYTTAQTSPLSLTTAGALRTDASATTQPVSGTFWQATQPVSGTVTTTPPANASTNVTQFGGTNLSTGTGTGGAGIPRVTVSSDSFPATQAVSGTVTANQGTVAAAAVTLTTVGITASASGDNTVISAVAAKKIYVISWNLSFSGSVNAKFTDGAAGTLLAGLYYGVVNSGAGASISPNMQMATPSPYLWAGSTNTALVINLSGAVAVGGSITYFTV